MAKYELKTKQTEENVEEFLDKIADENIRADSKKISEMMRQITKAEPKMWGASIIGFCSYPYKNTTGGGYEWMRIGFSPRKQNLTLYIMNGAKKYDDLLAKLGKHKIGKSCLYFKSLGDVDEKVLKEMIKRTVKYFNDKYGKN